MDLAQRGVACIDQIRSPALPSRKQRSSSSDATSSPRSDMTLLAASVTVTVENRLRPTR
jgi:hypothetical protein